MSLDLLESERTATSGGTEGLDTTALIEEVSVAFFLGLAAPDDGPPICERSSAAVAFSAFFFFFLMLFLAFKRDEAAEVETRSS